MMIPSPIHLHVHVHLPEPRREPEDRFAWAEERDYDRMDEIQRKRLVTKVGDARKERGR